MGVGISPQVEARIERDGRSLYNTCTGTLEHTVESTFGILTGFSAKMSGADVLLTLRATADGKRWVSFVGAETLANALLKATREARSGKLNWRPDRWQQPDSLTKK